MGRGDFSRPDFGRLKPPPTPDERTENKFYYFCEAQYLNSYAIYYQLEYTYFADTGQARLEEIVGDTGGNF